MAVPLIAAVCGCKGHKGWRRTTATRIRQVLLAEKPRVLVLLGELTKRKHNHEHLNCLHLSAAATVVVPATKFADQLYLSSPPVTGTRCETHRASDTRQAARSVSAGATTMRVERGHRR